MEECFSAIQSHNLLQLREIGKHIDIYQSNDGWNILFESVIAFNNDTLNYILQQEKGVDLINSTTTLIKHTPLHVAALVDNAFAVEALLSKGALLLPDKYNLYPFHYSTSTLLASAFIKTWSIDKSDPSNGLFQKEKCSQCSNLIYNILFLCRDCSGIENYTGKSLCNICAFGLKRGRPYSESIHTPSGHYSHSLFQLLHPTLISFFSRSLSSLIIPSEELSICSYCSDNASSFLCLTCRKNFSSFLLCPRCILLTQHPSDHLFIHNEYSALDRPILIPNIDGDSSYSKGETGALIINTVSSDSINTPLTVPSLENVSRSITTFTPEDGEYSSVPKLEDNLSVSYNVGKRCSIIAEQPDTVNFSAFAPPISIPKESDTMNSNLTEFLLYIFAFLPEQYDETIKRGKNLGSKEVGSKGPFPIQRGTIVKIFLKLAKEFECEEAVDTLLWNGAIANVSFPIKIKKGVQPGTKLCSARLEVNGIPIGTLRFSLVILLSTSLSPSKTTELETIPIETSYINSIFACYTIYDALQVIEWKTAMMQFNNKISIELCQELRIRVKSYNTEVWNMYDLFALFWNDKTENDKRVTDEWMSAIHHRGGEFFHLILLFETLTLPAELKGSLTSDQITRSFDRKFIPAFHSVLLDPSNKTRKMNSNELLLEEEIGRGNYGIVHKAQWRGATVIVKRVVYSMENYNEVFDLIKEVEVLERASNHPHVVRFLGACINDSEIWIVTEYVPNGNLHNLLSSNSLSFHEKVKMIYQASCGLFHLHKESIIHRDIAARNLLVNSTRDIKISDFGLSRFVSTSSIIINDMIGPLRWMAPETLLHGVYSYSSDIYSFGIMMYEVLTNEVPFKGIGSNTVINEVSVKGTRPIVSTKFNDILYIKYIQIMKSCWSTLPENRITSEALVKQLNNLRLSISDNTTRNSPLVTFTTQKAFESSLQQNTDSYISK